jgi:hypothetical protein
VSSEEQLNKDILTHGLPAPKPVARDPLLAEREFTHGNYCDTAHVAQMLKIEMHGRVKWSALSARQQESLDQIATKIGRILSGDPNEPEHWKDIAGYANLVVEAVQKKQL